MASITLQVGAEYATGTVLSVYNTVNSVPLTPVGSALTTGTVGSDGTVTFSGLPGDVTYLAYSSAGHPPYVRFYLPASTTPPVTGAPRGIEIYASDATYGLAAALTPAATRAALQAALDAAAAIASAGGAARGCSVILPAGSFFVDDELIFGDGVSIIGQGPGATALWASHDFGAGKFLLRPLSSRNNLHRSIRDLWLRGKSGSSTVGALPGSGSGVWAMDGLGVPSSTSVYDVVVDGGFRAGIHGMNDHWQLFGCISQGSYYNLYIGYDYGAEADQNCFGCDFTSALRASVGVAGSNVMGGMTLSGVHLGYSPYGIWKESQGDWANFPTFPGEPTPGSSNGFGGNPLGVSGCKFIDVAFESCANGLIGGADMLLTVPAPVAYSNASTYALNDTVTQAGVTYRALRAVPAGTGVTPGTEGTNPTYWAIFGFSVLGNEWLGCDVANNLVSAGAIAGEAHDTAIAASLVQSNYFRSSLQVIPPVGGYFAKVGLAGAVPLSNCFEVPDVETFVVVNVPGARLDDKAGAGGWVVTDTRRRLAESMTVNNGSAAIAKGDVLMRYTGAGDVRPFNDTVQAEMGVALEAAVASGCVWGLKRGRCARINVVGGLSPFGPWFTGSTTAGKATSSASRSGIARTISGDNGGWFVGEVV